MTTIRKIVNKWKGETNKKLRNENNTSELEIITTQYETEKRMWITMSL